MKSVRRVLKCGAVLSVLLYGHAAFAETDAAVSEELSLASLAVEISPWLSPAANSEQRQPLYLGATPREMALGIQPADGNRPLLYASLRDSGEAHVMLIRDALRVKGDLPPGGTLEFEAWPAVDEYGGLTWVFARWRVGSGSWKWLDSGILSNKPLPDPAPILPQTLDLKDKEDHAKVFSDVLEMRSLYDKPLFGECVFTFGTDAGETTLQEAWLDPDEMPRYESVLAGKAASGKDVPMCRALFQPARLNGKPVTFTIGVKGGDVLWPGEIGWKSEPAELPAGPALEPRIKEWPENFTQAYRTDVLILDGELPALFPLSKTRLTFKSKNCASADNQLQDVAAYLEERYRALGVKTVRQDFMWRGLPQSNLIAIIPGTDAGAKPVLMADHIDTAYCEDIYDETGKRVSAPGADDNVSATAVLLRAAEVLKDMAPRREIWLVHLTGEEFPPDDLGARHFVGKLLSDKKDIEGMILLDMIGYREKDDMIFQVNPGDSEGSLAMAKAVMDAAKGITGFTPVLRPRFDEKSYLYNTDGIIFSESGYPVVYINEHINRLENLYRKGYHHSTDMSMKMDWKYASDIAKVAIEAAAELADAGQ